jgi:uncharacterized damage-inducible protein DinB
MGSRAASVVGLGISSNEFQSILCLHENTSRRIFNMKAESASAVLEFLIPAVEQEAALTRKVLLAVPAEKGHHRPHDKAMSALELCWHIAATETFFITAVTTGAFAPFLKMPEEIKTTTDVVAWFDKQVAANVAKLKSMSGEQAAKIVESPFGARPAITFLNLSINHTSHHRGQLSTYLRPMGAKVPSIYGTSRDDKEAKEASAKH